MNRKNPSTSLDAYKQVSYEMLKGHYKKIIDALQVLGTATAEKIANHIGMDKNQVSRRMGELERPESAGGLEMVYKPGTVSLTSSKRKAFNYCLTGKGMPKVEQKTKPPVTITKPVFAKPLRLFE